MCQCSAKWHQFRFSTYNHHLCPFSTGPFNFYRLAEFFYQNHKIQNHIHLYCSLLITKKESSTLLTVSSWVMRLLFYCTRQQSLDHDKCNLLTKLTCSILSVKEEFLLSIVRDSSREWLELSLYNKHVRQTFLPSFARDLQPSFCTSPFLVSQYQVLPLVWPILQFALQAVVRVP